MGFQSLLFFCLKTAASCTMRAARPKHKVRFDELKVAVIKLRKVEGETHRP